MSLPDPTLSNRSSVPSPLLTHIPILSPSQLASHPYRPDIYPGARDVKTCYGSMRVYEWGPDTGRRVIMVHGDATCAPLWKDIAEGLVERGCRVIVLDLWGRGYSSSPNVIHESRIFALQILFAASSSPLPWCSEPFSIIGFSLGGSITLDFTASFPRMVRSVALLGPAGMLRSLPEEYAVLQSAVREGNPGDAEMRRLVASALGVEENAVEEEQTSKERKEGIDGLAIVRWQFKNHQGHARSFANTVANGPLQNQHEVWQEACDVLKAKQEARDGKEKLVVVCGNEDDVVPAEHVREDLEGMMGKERFVFETVPGGHGFPLGVENGRRIVEVVAEEWGL
ncbi:alpha/beta-hydrolase [Teratosphaeria nubilosa]|uniref:Alpha/beta-hydrolase n=1 Tax=Teratosphaeria nubilosa TaxID=161662 RepID=A0A6G1KVI6_9PEZI|nr:alpha/beta-hydrolase [Teratosphaeria nubilosa]